MTTATQPNYLSLMAVTDLPEATSGAVEVRRFTVNQREADLDRIRGMFASGGTRRSTPPGTYTALYRNRNLWMSDTPDERDDCLHFIRAVERTKCRTVLVNGLGLGSIIGALVHVPSVEVIRICEIDPDVIALVGRHVMDLGLAQNVLVDVRLGDAFTPNLTWGKGVRWDAAWHDIWPTICGEDYPEHKRIRRIYGRRTGFQEVWLAEEVRAANHRDRQHTYGGSWV